MVLNSYVSIGVMEEIELCRLCALEKNNLVCVYSDEGRRLNLESKIKKCLNIELATKINLPKSICIECCTKLDAFDEFLDSSQSAQTTLCILYPEEQIIVEECKVSGVSEEEEFDETEDERFIENSDVSNMILKSQKSENTGDYNPFHDDEYTDCNSGTDETKTNMIDQAKDSLEAKVLETWLCSDCSEEFNSVDDLRSHHGNVHKQEARYMCIHCSKVCLIYRKFLVHLRRHRNCRKYTCEECGKHFTNKKILDNHRLTHSDVRPFVCQECGKTFRQQSALYTHGRCHLPEDIKNKFPCDQCNKRFSTKPNLVTHMRIHSGIRNYTCDQCGKSFIQKGNLDAHLLTHSHDKPFSCELCNKRFKTGLQLRKHHSVHTGAKPHQCDICGRTFREKGTLREHHRIHSGVMPFTCEFCGKAFRFKGILTTHRRQHTGERPYSCVECQHHFTNWPNYNKHMKRRHGINTSRSIRSQKNDSENGVNVIITSLPQNPQHTHTHGILPHPQAATELPYDGLQTELYANGTTVEITSTTEPSPPAHSSPPHQPEAVAVATTTALTSTTLPTYMAYNVYTLSQVTTIDPNTTIELMPR